MPGRMTRRIGVAGIALCLALPAPLAAQPARDTLPMPEADNHREQMVAMRDGVALATSVYVPSGDGPWPVIVERTPYSKAGGAGKGQRLTTAGYVYVHQDSRGRFRSEGVYEPYQTDIEDGYDTIEWAAAQPWSNGKVGVTGRSAMGIHANLAAAGAPPHLVAAYVVTASESLFDESYFNGGVFREHFRGNFMRLQGKEDQIPIMKARSVLDEQWKRTDFIHHRGNVIVPMFNLGGWYDMFAKGEVGNFVALQHHGRSQARGNQKLWMGAWGHSPIDGDLEYPGDIPLGPRTFDYELPWFDHWLKGEDTAVAEMPAVTYYHMASARKGHASPLNGFRQADSWPPPSTMTRFYLQPGGGVGPARPTSDAASVSYVHDPDNPVPTFGGANYNNNRDFPITVGPVDQRQIGERPDYLRFHSEPLEADLHVQGRVDVELWVATDAPDTDFMVKLVDVYPDGYEAVILDTALRTRFRYGRETSDVEMMKPGRPTLLTIDLWSTSNTFERGHRLGVHIASSNAPRYEVNPNTGEAPGRATLTPRKATNTILHDQRHPSAIVLPVVAELPPVVQIP